jgi:hypothetical protein
MEAFEEMMEAVCGFILKSQKVSFTIIGRLLLYAW